MVTVVLSIPGLGPAGSLLCCGHEIVVYDMLSGACQRRVAGAGAGILSVVLMEDDQAVMSSRDGTLQLWNLTDLCCTWRVLADETGPLWCCTPSGDDRIYTGGEDGVIRGWQIPRANNAMISGMSEGEKGELLSSIEPLQCQMRAHEGCVTGLSAIQRMYTPAENTWLSRKQPWEMDAGPLLQETERRKKCGVQLVSAGADRNICVWDLKSGECRWRVQGHPGLPCCLVVNHRNGQYMSGGADGSLKCWDVSNCNNSGNVGVESEGNSGIVHRGSVLSLAVFPGGRIATGGADGLVKVWELHPLRGVMEMNGHATAVYSLAVIPNAEAPTAYDAQQDNSLLVSRSQDGHVIIWDPTMGTQITRLRVK